jgi:hypothetical protein
VGKTPFHLYTDSHFTLPKEGVRHGTRYYHLNSDVKINIEQKELLIFDGNLVHAGGDNTHPNPRIFATFGRTFKALETRNYIGLCKPCDFPRQCDLCYTLENIRNNHDDKNLIQGLVDKAVMYTCTGLESNGFVLEKIQIKATAALEEEISNLDNSSAINGITLQNMGQEKTKRSHGKGRKILIPLKEKKSSQTIEKNLPNVAKYMKSIEGIIKGRILAETGKVFRMNDYTILINSPHGADCQEPHMDHKLYCNCHK